MTRIDPPFSAWPHTGSLVLTIVSTAAFDLAEATASAFRAGLLPYPSLRFVEIAVVFQSQVVPRSERLIEHVDNAKSTQ